jgi:cysteine-rich repeat protein
MQVETNLSKEIRVLVLAITRSAGDRRPSVSHRRPTSDHRAEGARVLANAQDRAAASERRPPQRARRGAAVVVARRLAASGRRAGAAARMTVITSAAMTLDRVSLASAGCVALLVAGCNSTPDDTESASESASASATNGASTSDTTGASTTTGSATDTGSAAGTESTSDTSGSTTTASTSDTSGSTTSSESTSDTSDTSGSTTEGAAECGNGVVEAGEECDDGNLVDGDGCDATCTIDDLLCGNSVLDPGETCDDGNNDPDDGCAANCVTECGFLCLELGQPCITGFNAVQCASPGPPFGQASPIANTCQLATLSVDGNYIALSPETTIDGQPRHLDAMYTDPSNAVLGFAGDTQDIAAGSQLVEVNTETGELTPVGPSLGVWVMGAAMNDDGELWVTVFDTYESNQNTQVRIAEVDPLSGDIIDGPTLLTSNGQPVTVWSTHVSDVAFRFDGAMFLSANEPGPPPPEPLSLYFEVDRATANVLSTVEGPDDVYAAGIVFVGEEQEVVAMDIRGADDIFILDLAQPPTLNEALLYEDPIPTNSGTADLAGCSKLLPQ